jgi:tetratricopeptide (TPR) repeat protein
MDYFSEQPKFGIRSAIEQESFKNLGFKSFFQKWCETNGLLELKIVTRDEWVQKGAQGILENTPDGKQSLFIPQDLHLWEMIGVIEVVDRDTFVAKPERQNEKKERLLTLGKTFRNVGVYIAQRLDSIREGKEMAHALAEEFYSYGQLLTRGKKSKEEISASEITEVQLTPEDVAEVDHFLAGEALYVSRQARIEKVLQHTSGQTVKLTSAKKKELYEAERRKTLAQFFRASEKAFLLEQEMGADNIFRSSRNLRPWQSETPIHSAFLRKVTGAMEKQIEAPKRELVSTIFRRGLKELVGEMKEKKKWQHSINSLFKEVGVDLGFEQRKLANSLNLSGLKAELEAARQTGEMTIIVQKEREIVVKIQRAVSSYPYSYQGNSDTPLEIISSQFINCVGASMLGGALLSEIGINYLVGDVPKHSILVVVTSDGKIEWRDMLAAKFNEEITNGAIASKMRDGRSLTVKDIIAYANNLQQEGLTFDITGKRYKKKVPQAEEKQRLYLTVFPPEIGLQRQVLNNFSGMLYNLGLKETDPERQKVYYNQAVEAARETIAIESKYNSRQWRVLGNALVGLGRNEEGLEALRRATTINPEIPTWNELGNTLYDLGLKETDPERQKVYYNQAVEALQQFISLSHEQTDIFFHFGNAPLVRRARKIIAELA